MQIGYSETYSTEHCQYRYNYSTGQLEQIGKKINVLHNKGRPIPIVETGVIASMHISPSKFEKAPMFWVYLFEDTIKRNAN